MRWFRRRRKRRRGEGGFSRIAASSTAAIIVIGGVIAGNALINDGGEPPGGNAPTGPPAGTELCNNGADADAAYLSPYPALPTLSAVNADPQFADYDFTSVVEVPVGNNSDVIGANFLIASNTFYWFEPGVHTLNASQFAQIPLETDEYMAFVGGGTADDMAIFDGSDASNYAFTGTAENVTIQYLQIRDFVAPADQMIVNHDAGDNWVVSHNIIGPNEDGGAALGLGQNQVVTNNCMFQNGQYAINGYSANCASPPGLEPGGTCPVSGVLIDTNEIMENNWFTFDSGPATNVTQNGWATGALGAGCPNCGLDNYPTPGGPFYPGFEGNCGCSGAMKLWVEYDTDVTNNWIHSNHSQGIWADTINTDVVISGNYIANNWGMGIFYEVSYNAQITDNRFENNGWVSGSQNSTFPTGAIYFSESGYNAAVAPNNGSGFTAVDGNYFLNNWDGVVLWENADRFCTNGLPTGECTSPQIGDPENTGATLDTCDDLGVATNDPLTGQGLLYTCRWNTANVHVTNNYFEFDPDAIDPSTMTPYWSGDACADSYCGSQSIVSNFSSTAHWPQDLIAHSITWDQGNEFDNNEYVGPWTFDTNEPNQSAPFAPLTFTQWQTLTGTRGGSGVNTENHPAFDENSTCDGCL